MNLKMLGVAGLALAAACGGGERVVDTPVLAMALVSGDSQTVSVFSTASAPLVVRVTDQQGGPVSGIAVSWSAQVAGAAVTPASSSTDSSGQATTSYRAAVTAGAQQVVAEAAGLPPVTFTVLARAQAASRVNRVTGDGQSGTQGQTLPQPLVARVTDLFGNAVAGVTVNWSVTGGSGTLGSLSSQSDSAGLVSTTLTPTSFGTVTVAAAIAGGAPASFSASAGLGVTLVAAIPFSGYYHDQFVRDGIAFLAAWHNGLEIYDIGGGGRGGTPGSPARLGGVVTAVNGVSGGPSVHNAWWFHAPDGRKRYVFVGQEGPASGGIGVGSSGDIHVVDVSNMAAPVEVAWYHLSGLGPPLDSAGVHNFWMDEQNQILYAAYYNGGVVALDVSGDLAGNLATREIARVRPGGAGNTYTWGVQLYNGSLYANDMLSGLWQLRLSGGSFQVAGGNNVPERFGSDLWVHGGYAYTGTWGTRGGVPGNALKIWRLDANGVPVLADSIITSGITTVSDVEVSADGRLLMFSAENGPNAGIHFYDLSASPTRPRFMGRYATSTSGVHTATFAYVGGRRYVVAARNSPLAAIFLDVTAIGP